jgi:putative PIN family toxin of toxin-antitoxin system
MRVLLDTNVLVSAAATRGLCADLLREVLARHELVVCSQILTEVRRTLRSKFGASRELVGDFVALLQQDTICSKPGELPTLNLKDKDDLGILAAAESGGAHIIVTGDKALRDLGQFKGIEILSPRQFWQQLTTQ